MGQCSENSNRSYERVFIVMTSLCVMVMYYYSVAQCVYCIKSVSMQDSKVHYCLHVLLSCFLCLIMLKRCRSDVECKGD